MSSLLTLPVLTCTLASDKANRDGQVENTSKVTIDLRKVNDLSDTVNSGIPIFKDLAKRISGYNYYFSADMTKAYYQLPASEEYCYSRAFYVPGALMFDKRTPLGDASAPGVALAMDVFHSGIDREFGIVAI